MTSLRYIDLFKNKNFLALWLGQIISEFGDRFNQMALIASVYYGIEQGFPGQGRIVRLATLLAFTIIPVFLIGPVAGVYVDRWDRRRTMIWSDILRGGLVLFIPFLLIKMQMLLLIYLVVFLIFSTTRFFLPAKLGIIPDIVQEENLLLANSLTTTSRLIATVTGLGLGGIIIDLVGVRVGFYIDSATYFLSAFAIMLIRVPKPFTKLHENLLIHTKRIKEIEKNIFQDIRSSIGYILQHNKIPYVIKTLFILGGGLGAIYIIFIDFILKNLTVPPNMLQQLGRIKGFGQFGFIIVFLGIGAFLGTILFGKWGQRFRKEKAISGAFILSGLFLSLFTYFTYIFKNFWFTNILAMLLGLFAAPIMVLAYTLFHEVTTAKMRGRVFSTLEIAIHLAFFIFMFLSMFLVTTLKLPGIHILGISGGLACIYGLRGLVKKDT